MSDANIEILDSRIEMMSIYLCNIPRSDSRELNATLTACARMGANIPIPDFSILYSSCMLHSTCMGANIYSGLC